MKFYAETDIGKWARRNWIPLYGYFELTYKCNLECIHCYADVPHVGKELHYNEIISVLNQLANAGMLYICFSGGEPLIRKDFIEIMAHARALGFAVTILTVSYWMMAIVEPPQLNSIQIWVV